MGAAQGQYRGPQQDDERQYAGGDGAAQAGITAVAERTRARKAYMDSLARLDLHEVWEPDQATPGMVLPDAPWVLSHYRKAHTGERVDL